MLESSQMAPPYECLWETPSPQPVGDAYRYQSLCSLRFFLYLSLSLSLFFLSPSLSLVDITPKMYPEASDTFSHLFSHSIELKVAICRRMDALSKTSTGHKLPSANILRPVTMAMCVHAIIYACIYLCMAVVYAIM